LLASSEAITRSPDVAVNRGGADAWHSYSLRREGELNVEEFYLGGQA